LALIFVLPRLFVLNLAYGLVGMGNCSIKKGAENPKSSPTHDTRCLRGRSEHGAVNNPREGGVGGGGLAETGLETVEAARRKEAAAETWANARVENERRDGAGGGGR